MWNAGHILGSASVEIEAGGLHLLFSGDVGPAHKAFHRDPEAPAGFDHVVCESTYGDRARDDVTIEERRTLLEAERSEEHTSELQSLMRISSAVFCLKKKK